SFYLLTHFVIRSILRVTNQRERMKMNIKQNIKNLLDSSVTNYRIHKDIGVAQSTLSDLVKGKSNLDDMKLGVAVKLNDYYIKNKEMIEMIRINLDEFGFEGEVVVNKGIVEKINKFFGWEDEEKVIRHIESDIVDMLEENE